MPIYLNIIQKRHLSANRKLAFIMTMLQISVCVCVCLCVCLCVSHCCTRCGAADCPEALTQQGQVDVDVIFSVCITEENLKDIPDVTIQSAHQGAAGTQVLKRRCCLSTPAALQEENHNNFIHKTSRKQNIL